MAVEPSPRTIPAFRFASPLLSVGNVLEPGWKALRDGPMVPRGGGPSARARSAAIPDRSYPTANVEVNGMAAAITTSAGEAMRVEGVLMPSRLLSAAGRRVINGLRAYGPLPSVHSRSTR